MKCKRRRRILNGWRCEKQDCCWKVYHFLSFSVNLFLMFSPSRLQCFILSILTTRYEPETDFTVVVNGAKDFLDRKGSERFSTINQSIYYRLNSTFSLYSGQGIRWKTFSQSLISSVVFQQQDFPFSFPTSNTHMKSQTCHQSTCWWEKSWQIKRLLPPTTAKNTSSHVFAEWLNKNEHRNDSVHYT